MTLAPEQEAELRELLDAVYEDRVSPETTARLEAALRDRPEAQQFYLRCLHLHGSMRWELGQAADWEAVRRLKPPAAEPSPAAGPDPTSAPKSLSIVPHPRRFAGVPRRYAWSAATAAALVLAAFFAYRRTEPVPQPPPPEARLSGVTLAHAVDARWDAAISPRLNPGDSLPEGRIGLASGLARLDFPGGASVTLEGPAEFTVAGDRRGILHRGSLTAKAPAEAGGFRIDTPSLAVVELGTTFGMQTDATGRSEVQVFDGEVVVSLPQVDGDPAGSSPQTLGEGTAARVEATRREIVAAPFDGSDYRRTWPLAYGVLAATGSVKFVEPKPHLVPRRHEDDAHLVVFPERESIVLKSELAVAVVRTGRHAGPFDPQSAKLPAGRRVRSYLMQFNPVGREPLPVRALRGSITFDRPIVGLICNTKPLAETDPLFSFEPNWRAGRGGGGIEAGDIVIISDDRRTLSVDLTAAAANDQIRVLVESPIPTNVMAGR